MSIEKLKGAAEARGGKLIYNRSLGFYEVASQKEHHKYIGRAVLEQMDVPHFLATFFQKKVNDK